MLSKLQQPTKHMGLWMTLIFLFGGLLFRMAGETQLSNSAFLLGIGSGMGWGLTW